jgi:hypothetical protein
MKLVFGILPNRHNRAGTRFVDQIAISFETIYLLLQIFVRRKY